MADVGASDAVERIRSLRCHKNKIEEVVDKVRLLVSALTYTHELLNYPNLKEDVTQFFIQFAHEIEETLEIFVFNTTVMLQKNEGWFIKRFFRKLFPALVDGFVLMNIEAYISEFHQLVLPVMNYYLLDLDIIEAQNEWAASQSQGYLRQTYPRGIDEYFVGMDDDLKTLVSLIFERQNRVISIWGVTGSGKTTITGKICKQPKARMRFRGFAWVCLSRESEISLILLNILRQLSPRVLINETSQMETLIDKLKDVQRRKDCLIVLDNVQNINQWNQLSPALAMEGGRSVTLLTTREEIIANEVTSHKLGLLKEDEAWDLLKKHAFPRKDGPDYGLFPRLGKEMVRQCGYLPSAISRLGRVLSSKISSADWQMVSNDVSKYIQGQQMDGDEQSVSSSDSNYYKLPYYLRQCFLYLGIFSKDEEIDVEDLYFLWIAEGMVSSVNEVRDIANEDREESTLDRAAKCLTALASREMVRVQWDELSATRSQPCFLHSPAGELDSWEKENEHVSLEMIDICNGKQSTFSRIDFFKSRKLAIHFNQERKLEDIDWLLTHHPHPLRSLFLLNSGKISVEMPLTITDFGKFKLRVLKFVRCKFDGRKLPKGIDRLFNLRYLGLFYCDLDELPSSIGNLINLRVLNLRVHENYRLGIPQALNRLTLLKHLRLPYCIDREQTQKLRLDGLHELETLQGFNSLIHDIKSLSKLKKLRCLGAHVYSNECLKSLLGFIESQGASKQINLLIENLCDFTSKEGVNILQDLLMCPSLDALTMSMVLIREVPDCGPYLSKNLTQLKLIGCRIKNNPMKVLGKFPNLQKLCFGYGAFVGTEMTVQANDFPKLAYLEMRCLPDFETWRVDEGAMCNLSDLIIRRCPRLKMIPDGLRSIDKLKNLEIELAPEAFEEVTVEEYHRNFAFVPSRIIRRVDPCSTSENSYR